MLVCLRLLVCRPHLDQQGIGSRLLNTGTTDSGTGKFLAVGGCLARRRTLSRIPGLFPRDFSSSPTPDCDNLKKAPNIATCPLGTEPKLFPVENHWTHDFQRPSPVQVSMITSRHQNTHATKPLKTTLELVSKCPFKGMKSGINLPLLQPSAAAHPPPAKPGLAASAPLKRPSCVRAPRGGAGGQGSAHLLSVHRCLTAGTGVSPPWGTSAVHPSSAMETFPEKQEGNSSKSAEH